MTFWWPKGPDMATYVTKEQFDGGIASLRQDIRELVKEMRDGFSKVNGQIEDLQTDMELVKHAVLETATEVQGLQEVIQKVQGRRVTLG